MHANSTYTTIYPHPAGDIHLVLDFGREIIGKLTLEIDAPADTIIDLLGFEAIDDSGIYWPENVRNGLRYICRAGYQQFTSHQRRGFRYISMSIRHHTRPVKLYHLGCLLSTYPVENKGAFACSDAQLTRIWEIARYTTQLCMEDTYTDCPMYEQTAWVGDARISALVNATVFGAFDLTQHHIELTGQSLSDLLKPIMRPALQSRPHLTDSLVASGWFIEIPMWSFLWVWNIWDHYQICGDHSWLAERYVEVELLLERSQQFLTERHLLNIPDVWNLVDWAAMDLTAEGEVTANTALLVSCFRLARLMVHELTKQGHNVTSFHSAEYYDELVVTLVDAINQWCWDEQRGAYVDTLRDAAAYQRYLRWCEPQHGVVQTQEQYLAQTRISEPTNTLLYLCDCVPETRKARIWPHVMAAQEGHFVGSGPERAPQWPADRVVPVGSPWFLFFTLETLLQAGKQDMVLRLIQEQWGSMLEKGATTFWETFPSYVSGHWSRSLCHSWSSAPAYFLPTLLLGIYRESSDFVRIQPYFGDLRWAQGQVPTSHGSLHVRWQRQDDTIILVIVLPGAMNANLTLPEGYNWSLQDKSQPTRIPLCTGEHRFVIHRELPGE